MKMLGVVILGIGLAITLITGFSYVTKEKVVDIGEVQISRNKKHNVAWSPVTGVVLMVIGGGILIWGIKKK